MTGEALRQGRAWNWATHGYALLSAVTMTYFVLGIPVQLWDLLADLFQVMGQSAWDLVVREMAGSRYMRPLARVQFKLVYDLAGGEQYFLVFKAVHVAQVVAASLLFARLLRVRGWSDALVVPFGFALLFGAHTFVGTVEEAYPLNNYLTAMLAALAAADMALSPPSWWRGPAAVLLFVVAALTIESGLLVWVVLAAAWMVGGKGVPLRTLALVTLLLAAYVVVRLTLLQTAVPGLQERPSGFGFRLLEPPDLQARFGDSPAVFYAYNVASQILSVLFAEPRVGVWATTRDMLAGALRPSQAIGLVASTGATAMVGWYVASRLRQWLRREFDHTDRVVFIFVAVLAGNAVISFAYAKDVIMAPAGAFHALAGALALRALLPRLSELRPRLVTIAAVVLCLISTASVVRLAGTCYILRERSFVTRNDWALFDEWAQRFDFDIDKAAPEQAALVRHLRDDAIDRRTPAPLFAQGRAWRFFY